MLHTRTCVKTWKQQHSSLYHAAHTKPHQHLHSNNANLIRFLHAVFVRVCAIQSFADSLYFGFPVFHAHYATHIAHIVHKCIAHIAFMRCIKAWMPHRFMHARAASNIIFPIYSVADKRATHHTRTRQTNACLCALSAILYICTSSYVGTDLCCHLFILICLHACCAN